VVFIDDQKKIYTDFPDVCSLLRKHITKKSKGLDWNDAALRSYVTYFKEKERELLPPKKKRALEVAEHILERNLKRQGIKTATKKIIESHLKLLKPNSQFAVDYELLADEWITILQPLLTEKRAHLKGKRKVINLSSLKNDRKINFPEELLSDMLENAPITDDIDNKIASCIIGIADGGKT